jgi:hypothetical protein
LTNWKETMILNISMATKYTWLKDLLSMYYGKELSHVCEYTRELDLTCVRKVLFLVVVTFQNLVNNSYNARHVTHLQLEHTPKNLNGKVDWRLGLLGTQ